jgi:hypothetical protein
MPDLATYAYFPALAAEALGCCAIKGLEAILEKVTPEWTLVKFKSALRHTSRNIWSNQPVKGCLKIPLAPSFRPFDEGG